MTVHAREDGNAAPDTTGRSTWLMCMREVWRLLPRSLLAFSRLSLKECASMVAPVGLVYGSLHAMFPGTA